MKIQSYLFSQEHDLCRGRVPVPRHLPEPTVHPLQQGVRQAERLFRRIRRTSSLRSQRVRPRSGQRLRPQVYRHQGIVQVRVQSRFVFILNHQKNIVERSSKNDVTQIYILFDPLFSM